MLVVVSLIAKTPNTKGIYPAIYTLVGTDTEDLVTQALAFRKSSNYQGYDVVVGKFTDKAVVPKPVVEYSLEPIKG